MKVFYIVNSTLFTELKKLAPISNEVPSKLRGRGISLRQKMAKMPNNAQYFP